MFPRLPNQWTPVLPLAALTDNPVAAEIAGVPIVLFRDADGDWHALRDYCPHRGAALSRGRVTEAGHLRCGYHGWRFDGDGRCTGVPLNELNEAALRMIRADALPTRAMGGAVWVYTRTAPDADVPEPLLPDSLTGDPTRFVTYTQEWSAHWTRAVENFIDFAHPPYLHESTIGAWTLPFAERGGIAQVDVQRTAFGMTFINYLGSRSHGFRLDWYAPNMSILHFGATAYNCLHVFSIPVSETHTRVMTVRRMPAEVDAESYSARASGADHHILDEDRDIVETQHGDVLSDPHEISVATDAPSVAFRRWYAELIG